MSSFAGILLGLVVGLRHAFEPDHLTAMATLAQDTPGARRGAIAGAIWGVGHTLSLVVVAIVLIALGEALPDHVAARFELVVAGVLVLLGIRAIVRAIREGAAGPTHEHAHGVLRHLHAGPAAHLHVGRRALAWRPLAVGLVHGLAGSGALTAIAFAKLPTPASQLVYIALFGLGSVVGMATASALASASLGAVSQRTQRALLGATGALSIVLGITWSVPLWAQI